MSLTYPFFPRSYFGQSVCPAGKMSDFYVAHCCVTITLFFFFFTVGGSLNRERGREQRERERERRKRRPKKKEEETIKGWMTVRARKKQRSPRRGAVFPWDHLGLLSLSQEVLHFLRQELSNENKKNPTELGLQYG